MLGDGSLRTAVRWIDLDPRASVGTVERVQRGRRYAIRASVYGLMIVVIFVVVVVVVVGVVVVV